MIKSLSPYYITIPFVSPLTAATCTAYTLNVYVWDGVKGSAPVTASYSFTKPNPTASTGNDTINIARILNDFLTFAPVSNNATALIDGVNQRWVKTTVVYTTADIDDLDVEQSETISLMTKGYGYGMEGANPSVPANNILLSGTEFKVNRTGNFILPILIQETP